MKIFIVVFALGTLTGCIPTYSLVRPDDVSVIKGALAIKPTVPWNKVPSVAARTKWEESWTLNGPLLDRVVYVAGLPDGKAIVTQRKKDDQKVPEFRATMSPQDLASMLEASYRVAGVTVFKVEGLKPAQFLGGGGLSLDYSYAPSDGMSKRGRCVMRVVNGKLYLMNLDGASSHYFDAVAPEFDRMVASANLK